MIAPGSPRTPSAQAALFARGLAMGVAEVVPGVSGGTIAFITGIYDELVRSLASFSGTALAAAPTPAEPLRGWTAFARRHNLAFFAVLGMGMALGVLVLSRVIPVVIDAQPVLVSGFFFGLIAASVAFVGAESTWRWLLTAGAAGLAVGLFAGLFGDAQMVRSEATVATLFVAGALAATAWILPGVSGAFVLLLMGLYRPMLDAVAAFDLTVITAFGAGLCLGLLAFSKLLAWLLDKARAALLALLTGFMAGSLTQLWPWRDATAESAPLIGVLATIASGALIVGALAYVARGKRA